MGLHGVVTGLSRQKSGGFNSRIPRLTKSKTVDLDLDSNLHFV